jgi:CubicO group peptidase (beta-lactamase class C family)
MAIATRQGAVWTGSVGLANVVSQSGSHAGYLYGIGSITKMFVACVVEQLIDEGRLTPTARVRDVLGEEVIQAIPNADRATVGSNTNYTLLRLIIEKVTGKEAVSEIHRRLLDSRGMTDVKFEGFETVDGARLPARYQFGTAGGIVATPHDLALFARDPRDGRVVSADALARI